MDVEYFSAILANSERFGSESGHSPIKKKLDFLYVSVMRTAHRCVLGMFCT